MDLVFIHFPSNDDLRIELLWDSNPPSLLSAVSSVRGGGCQRSHPPYAFPDCTERLTVSRESAPCLHFFLRGEGFALLCHHHGRVFSAHILLHRRANKKINVIMIIIKLICCTNINLVKNAIFVQVTNRPKISIKKSEI